MNSMQKTCLCCCDECEEELATSVRDEAGSFRHGFCK